MENVKEKPGQRPGWVGWRVVRPEGKGGGNGLGVYQQCKTGMLRGSQNISERKKFIWDGNLYLLSTTIILMLFTTKIATKSPST